MPPRYGYGRLSYDAGMDRVGAPPKLGKVAYHANEANVRIRAVGRAAADNAVHRVRPRGTARRTSARATAKQLLKVHRTSVELFHAYARLELHSGRVDEVGERARGLLRTHRR